MTPEPPLRSAYHKLWAWLLGALAFVIGFQVLVAVLIPVLPWLVVALVVVVVIYVVRGARYR